VYQGIISPMNINILKFLLLIIFLTSFASATQKVSLQLQWKYQFQFAGYIVAKEKGFYKEGGMDVELREWTPGLDMIQEVIKGKSTFSIARPTSFIDHNTINQVQFLGAIYQSSPLVLLTDKSLGIEHIKDFKGKTLMSSGDLRSDASIVSMMYSHGVDFKSLNVKKPSFDVTDLLNGKTDLIASYVSNEPYVLKKMGGNPVIFDPKDYGFDFYNDILITSTQLTVNDPKLVEDFLDATLKGWNYAFENVQETAKLIYEKYNTQNKSLDALIYEGRTLKPLALDGVVPLGTIKKEKMQRMYDIYRLLGIAHAKDIDFDKLIYSLHKKDVILDKEEQEYIEKSTIKVGVSPWYPMTFYDENKENIDGIGIEILQSIAEKLGLKMEFVPAKWSVLLEKFKNKELDLLPTTYYTNERSKFGNFSKPYMDIKEYLYVHEDSDINGFSDLFGKKLAIVKKYAAIQRIKVKYPDIEIVEVDTLEQSIKMLLNKEVDALFNTQFSIESFLMKNHIFSIKPIYQISFESSSLHLFSQLDDIILKNILQKGLDATKKAEIDNIVANWLRKTSNSLFSLPELRYINENRVVKMCVNPNWTPIEFIEGEEPEGITIDILKLISERTNLKFEHIPTKSWSESQEFLKQRKCDILPAATKTSLRQKYANFTKPYLSYNLSIVTSDDKPLVSHLDEIVDKSMSRKEGSGIITTLKQKYPHLDIVETSSYKEAFELVQDEKTYFTIATLPVLSYYKNRYSFDNLQVAGYTDMKYDLSIMVRDDNKILLRVLNKALQEISAEQKKLIHEKWTNKKIESHIDYDLLIKIMLLSLVVISFFIYKQIVLNKSVKESQELINATMEGIIILEGHILKDANESAINILGYDNKEKLLGKNIFDFMPEKYHDLVKNKMEQEKSEPYEIHALAKNGKEIPILARGRSIKDNTLRLVSIVDISILKQQEEQLIQQAKLVSMGEMIGNIAHQWRQPLSVISTSASGIKVQKEYGILEDEFLFEACDAIDNNVQYLSQTIDDFRDFIKGDRTKKKVYVEELINSFIHLIEASSKINEIDIVTQIDKNIAFECYENELKQCFMNIYNNAKDVLKDKHILQKLLIIKVVQEGKYLSFYFTDNGGGIPQKILPNIFDPYFTTKHQSQGTGLGLSMTYNLITRGMEGTIKAENTTFNFGEKVYKGAQFKVQIKLNDN